MILFLCMLLWLFYVFVLYLLMQKEENQGEFYSLFLFMVAGLLLMVSSSNLILIFIDLKALPWLFIHLLLCAEVIMLFQVLLNILALRQ